MADQSQENFREERARAARTRLALASLNLFAGFITLLFREELAGLTFVYYSVFLTVGIGFSVTGFSLILLLYLRGDLAFAFSDSEEALADRGRARTVPGVVERLEAVARGWEAQQQSMDAELQRFRATVALASDKVGATRIAVELPDDHRERLSASVVAAIRKDLSGEIVRDLDARIVSLQQHRAEEFNLNTDVIEAIITIEAAIQRIESEIRSLGRRGDVNLLIGSIVTLFAAGLLVLTALQPTISSDWFSLLHHYIPRVTTVVFTEVFAFFFLQLYKSGLADIKYYQNELTNLQMRAAVLQASKAERVNDATGNILRSMVSEDRNTVEGARTRDAGGASIDPKLVADLVERAVKLASASGG